MYNEEIQEEESDENQDQVEGEIRCVCGSVDDDGFTIQCEECLVWQHTVCVNLTPETIPEVYLCEKCDPRWLDVERAINEQEKFKMAQEKKLALIVDKEKNRVSQEKKVVVSQEKPKVQKASSTNEKYKSLDASIAHRIEPFIRKRRRVHVVNEFSSYFESEYNSSQAAAETSKNKWALLAWMELGEKNLIISADSMLFEALDYFAYDIIITIDDTGLDQLILEKLEKITTVCPLPSKLVMREKDLVNPSSFVTSDQINSEGIQRGLMATTFLPPARFLTEIRGVFSTLTDLDYQRDQLTAFPSPDARTLLPPFVFPVCSYDNEPDFYLDARNYSSHCGRFVRSACGNDLTDYKSNAKLVLVYSVTEEESGLFKSFPGSDLTQEKKSEDFKAGPLYKRLHLCLFTTKDVQAGDEIIIEKNDMYISFPCICSSAESATCKALYGISKIEMHDTEEISSTPSDHFYQLNLRQEQRCKAIENDDKCSQAKRQIWTSLIGCEDILDISHGLVPDTVVSIAKTIEYPQIITELKKEALVLAAIPDKNVVPLQIALKRPEIQHLKLTNISKLIQDSSANSTPLRRVSLRDFMLQKKQGSANSLEIRDELISSVVGESPKEEVIPDCDDLSSSILFEQDIHLSVTASQLDQDVIMSNANEHLSFSAINKDTDVENESFSSGEGLESGQIREVQSNEVSGSYESTLTLDPYRQLLDRHRSYNPVSSPYAASSRFDSPTPLLPIPTQRSLSYHDSSSSHINTPIETSRSQYSRNEIGQSENRGAGLKHEEVYAYQTEKFENRGSRSRQETVLPYSQSRNETENNDIHRSLELRKEEVYPFAMSRNDRERNDDNRGAGLRKDVPLETSKHELETHDSHRWSRPKEEHPYANIRNETQHNDEHRGFRPRQEEYVGSRNDIQYNNDQRGSKSRHDDIYPYASGDKFRYTKSPAPPAMDYERDANPRFKNEYSRYRDMSPAPHLDHPRGISGKNDIKSNSDQRYPLAHSIRLPPRQNSQKNLYSKDSTAHSMRPMSRLNSQHRNNPYQSPRPPTDSRYSSEFAHPEYRLNQHSDSPHPSNHHLKRDKYIHPRNSNLNPDGRYQNQQAHQPYPPNDDLIGRDTRERRTLAVDSFGREAKGLPDSKNRDHSIQRERSYDDRSGSTNSKR